MARPLGEDDPERIVRLYGACAWKRGAAGADNFGEVVIDRVNLRVAQELGDRGHAGGRAGIKERSAGGCVAVALTVLGEDAVDDQEVAEDADASL
jgi:hypothetical protein